MQNRMDAAVTPVVCTTVAGPVVAVEYKNQFVDWENFEAKVSNCGEFVIGGMITNRLCLLSTLSNLHSISLQLDQMQQRMDAAMEDKVRLQVCFVSSVS